MLLPVAALYSRHGVMGYFYIKNSLFREWQEAAILRLERAAHTMDMLLREPLQWMQAFAKTGGGRQGAENRQWILKQLQDNPGVSRVELTWRDQAAPPEAPVAQVSPPQYFYPQGQKAVGLRSELLDAAGLPLGRLEVWVKFDYLMQDLLSSGWMQSNMACLVNDSGVYLAHSNPAMQSRHCLGETRNPLELAMREEIKEKDFGIILGEGQAIGFYRLHQAPWAIMLHAQASQILAPIRRFHFYYLVGRPGVPGSHPGAHPPGSESPGLGHPEDVTQSGTGGQRGVRRAPAG